MTELVKPILIVVEGKDEINFFEAFLKHLKLEDYEIREVSGKDNFKYQLQTLIATTGFNIVKKLVLIRDADENSENTLISLQNTLKSLELPIPQNEGEYFSQNGLTCGIYVMPKFPEIGMLEDLCLQSITKTKEIECIDKFIECIDNKPSNLAKTKTQIYLSIQNPIVNNLGIGAKKGYWDFKHLCFNKLKQFIEKLKD